MAIVFADERDLQRKIANKITQGAYIFQVMKSDFWCDVADRFHNIYIEVKIKGKFAPSQLLYGSVYTVNNKLEYKPQYFGLANENELKFYKAPPYEQVESFARMVSAAKEISPSQVPHRYDKEAYGVLGDPIAIITNYDAAFSLDQPYIFIMQSNIKMVKEKLEKYHIDVKKFISFASDVWINGGTLTLLQSGGIVETVHGKKLKSRPIKNKADQDFILHLRITPEDLTKIAINLDQINDITDRRKFGQFYTGYEMAVRAYNIIMEYIEPDVIIDPFVGTGSLLLPFGEDMKYIINDLDEGALNVAKVLLEGRDVEAYNEDMLKKRNPKLEKSIYDYSRLHFDKKNVLVYSNPPFGSKFTVMGRNGGSIPIEVHDDDLAVYGTNDLVMPAIVRMAKFAMKFSATLAFYAPFSFMLRMVRYQKLLKFLAKNFDSLSVTSISGSQFSSVNKENPIILTIWRCKNG